MKTSKIETYILTREGLKASDESTYAYKKALGNGVAGKIYPAIVEAAKENGGVGTLDAVLTALASGRFRPASEEYRAGGDKRRRYVRGYLSYFAGTGPAKKGFDGPLVEAFTGESA